MQRVKVTYRLDAIADLKQINTIVAGISQSRVVANRFVQRIMARCRKIGDASALADSVPMGYKSSHANRCRNPNLHPSSRQAIQ